MLKAAGRAALHFREDSEAGHLGLGEPQGLKLRRSHGHQAAQALGLKEDLLGATGTSPVQHGLDDLGVGEGFGTIEGHAFGDCEALG